MFIFQQPEHSIALRPITQEGFDSTYVELPPYLQNWFTATRFQGKSGQYCVVPDGEGRPDFVFVGYDRDEGLMWALSGLPASLPEGDYHLSCEWSEDEQVSAAIGWGLGAYNFDQYRENKNARVNNVRLYVPEQGWRVAAFSEAITLVRNLVNMPANDMMPENLELVVQQLCELHQASYGVIAGDDLLRENFPAIHAVGRASHHAPRLLELNWGDENHPRVSLVGKGVCFDTGGLDIKPSQYMRLMKKDMGGAAHVLGLAKLIMQLQLPINLQVLIPAVDNAIGGNAFRPGDILQTRSGKTVEVDNTDAEGRLVLCDALSYAAEEAPHLILDFATLTGAARVALGTEIPVFFSNDRHLMQQLQVASTVSGELIWNLPMHKPYFEQLRSNCADMVNAGGSYGGAITAALYLNEFVPNDLSWAHFDVMAWNNRARPGRPVGGEAMGLLAVFEYLETTFSNNRS